MIRNGKSLTDKFREVSAELQRNRTRSPSTTTQNKMPTAASYANKDPDVVSDEDEVYPVPGMPSFLKKLNIELNEELPDSIIQYLRQMEMLVSKVVSDCLKKFYHTAYLPTVTLQDRWRSLPEYHTGTYEEYVRAIVAFYPAAAALQRGSRETLESVFARHRNIRVDERDKFQRFNLHVRTEAKKLENKSTDKSRSLITNIELVRKILACLDQSFRSSVRLRLSLKKPSTPAQTAPASASGPGGLPSLISDGVDYDPYAWEDVLTEAANLCHENTGEGGLGESRSYDLEEPSFGPSPGKPLNYVKMEDRDAMIAGAPPPSRLTSDMDELKRMMEQSQRQMANMHKDTLAQIQKLEADQEETRSRIRDINQYQQAAAQKAAAQPAVLPPQQSRDNERYDRYNRGSAPPQKPRGSCYYCGSPGHFASDCNARTRHFAEGLLTMRDGRPVIASNGQPLPMIAPQGSTLKDMVEQGGSSRSVNMMEWDCYNDYPSFEQKVEQSLTRLGDGLLNCTQQLKEMRQGSAYHPQAAPAPPSNKSLADMVTEMYKLSVQGQDFH